MSDHHPYIDLHWLYQIALVGLDRLGGGPALVLAHAALIVGAFAVVARVTWQRFRSALVVAVVLLLGVLASELRFMIRPETVSWLFLAVIMLILERRAAGQAAPLWVLPIIHLAWVNVEGLFVLGWIVTGCYLVGGLLEQHRLDRSLAIWGGASVLISFVNPYFIQGVLFPVTLMTRMSKENPFGQTISEFVSPWQLNLPLPWSAWAYYLLAGMVVIGLILTRTQRRPWEFLLALAFLLLSALAIRNIPLFVIVAMPILAGCLCNLSQMFASRHGKKTRPSGRVAAWLETARRLPVGAVLIVLVSVGLTLRVLTDAYYISARRPALKITPTPGSEQIQATPPGITASGGGTQSSPPAAWATRLDGRMRVFVTRKQMPSGDSTGTELGD